MLQLSEPGQNEEEEEEDKEEMLWMEVIGFLNQSNQCFTRELRGISVTIQSS
jgi:hypothetical protein